MNRAAPAQHVTVQEPHTDSTAHIGDGFLRLHRHGGTSGVGFYWMGEFVDRRGFVSVYRQDGLTRLDIVHGGRLHIRTWRKYFGDRTIARLARAFLTELAGS